MKTLIELYDERPVENVLATEVFKPETTVFLCPPEVAQSKKVKKNITDYFKKIGIETELVFLESSMYNSEKLLNQLKKVFESYPDCVVDITGGTDAALFACGRLTEKTDIPAFTYSRKRQTFFNIHNASFADNVRCSIKHKVEDCFRMAGGSMRKGRVDNAALGKYMKYVEPYFRLYLNNRVGWGNVVSYIQSVSQCEKGKSLFMNVDVPFIYKNGKGKTFTPPEKALREFVSIGFVHSLKIDKTDGVSFVFRDSQIRTWMRDNGSVLELYVYKICVDSGIFNDVRTSAVVDWEGVSGRDSVSNEIDVIAMDGILPLFISCKTCAVTTEAINELAVLRDRFGGYGAKAAIVTTQYCRNITRHRASEMGINIFDLEDIKSGNLSSQIVSLMKKGK